MPRALIALGSNVGESRATLNAALARLAALPGARLLAQSRWLETTPVGGPTGQAAFLNGAALFDVSGAPEEWLDHMQAIETALGRRRDVRWGPRTLDLDLLLFDDVQQRTERLELPHPRLTFRPFVVEPAAEVAPDWVVPGVGWSLGQLRDHLRRKLPTIVLTGSNLPRVDHLARSIAARDPLVVRPDLPSPAEARQTALVVVVLDDPREVPSWRARLQQAEMGPRLILVGTDEPRHAEEIRAALDALR